ncbi:hypothetical protein B0T22DRAFT_510837 [Podospora appendiculata]|uniref:F-box domain-containing protein n=1 Tax=Podospora appendiculata TaxID=314037 RepID=A0AAE0X8Z1_9PEZI|nr:hypothetical protein B0T22DRAFT_510837 [Podospora appendiculata]
MYRTLTIDRFTLLTEAWMITNLPGTFTGFRHQQSQPVVIMNPETDMELGTYNYIPEPETGTECQCNRPALQRRHSCAGQIPSAPTPVPLAPLPLNRSFLDLPPEIRLRIYELVLRRSPVSTIYTGSNRCVDCTMRFRLTSTAMKLFPAILLTCRQILFEGRRTLYENETWKIEVTDDYGMGSGHDWAEGHPTVLDRQELRITGSRYFMTDRHLITRDRVRDLRRFHVTLNFYFLEQDAYLMAPADAAQCVDQARQAVREVCDALSTVPGIKYLGLRLLMDFPDYRLGDDDSESEDSNSDLGEPAFADEEEWEEEDAGRAIHNRLMNIVQTYFGGLLRGVNEVEIAPAYEDLYLPDGFAESLTKQMMGAEPVNPLIERYAALERLVQGVAACETSLESVREALEMGLDATEFEDRMEATLQIWDEHI